MPVNIDHIKKTVTFTKNISDEENLLIADLVNKGYKARPKTSSQSGHNKAWYLKQLPNDEARKTFQEMCSSEKGLGGFRKAKTWAKDAHGIG